MVFYPVDQSITLVFMNAEPVQREGELVESVGELVEPTSFRACHHPYRPFRLLDLTLPVDRQ